jgi:hypothetical protein
MILEAKDYIAIVAVMISIAAIYIAWRNAKEQGVLTERLNKQDVELDRKKLVTALWDRMSNLWEVRANEADQYNETYVWENLNSLELIAVCWENNIVDQQIVFLVCGKNYVLRVKEIEAIAQPLKELRKTGPELLHERQVILNVKRKFEDRL